MDNTNLKIEYIDVDKLTPYQRNTRKHTDKDIDIIAKSIEKYGFNDAIGIWSKKNKEKVAQIYAKHWSKKARELEEAQ